MTLFDQSNASCHVLTFKEGLLSPVAHDLRLLVTRFSVRVTDAIEGTFDTGSLIVDTAMKDGAENPSVLSRADTAKIATQIADVLRSAKYPQALFRSSSHDLRSDGGYDIQGVLTLHGVTRSLSVQTHLVDGRQLVELTLHQPDFGITPFKAMLGTLKIQANVRVRLRC